MKQGQSTDGNCQETHCCNFLALYLYPFPILLPLIYASVLHGISGMTSCSPFLDAQEIFIDSMTAACIIGNGVGWEMIERSKP